MEDQDLLTEIAYRASDEVLLSFSKIPSVWKLLVPIMQKQHFWYRRTLEAFNLPPQYQEEGNQNWHQIYNILTLTRDRNDPFSAEKRNLDILELNKYNLTAIKILLSWGYDPSSDYSHTLRQAAVFGSPELVQLLLNDKRIDPIDEESYSESEIEVEFTGASALEGAAEYSRTDNMKILLADKRIQAMILYHNNIISNVVDNSVTEERTEVFELMLDYAIEQDLEQDLAAWSVTSGMTASSNGIIGILDVLINKNLLRLGKNIIEAAINNDQVEALIILLDRAKYLASQGMWVVIPSEEDMSKTAISSSSPKIVRMFIENGYLSKLSIDQVLSRTINQNRIRTGRALKVLDIILEEDPRISQSQDLIINMLNSNVAARTGGEFRVALAKSRYVNIDKLSANTRELIMLDSSEARDTLDKASELAGISYREARSIMSIDTENGNFNKYHFEMLLTEIILKRLDLEYYIDWIIAHLSREDISQELRDLFSAAADSVLSDEPVIHTSDLFTAYSGFLLLANSKDRDVEAVMNTLREELSEHSEEGVTEEGLKKAALLLGAFSGREQVIRR